MCQLWHTLVLGFSQFVEHLVPQYPLPHITPPPADRLRGREPFGEITVPNPSAYRPDSLPNRVGDFIYREQVIVRAIHHNPSSAWTNESLQRGHPSRPTTTEDAHAKIMVVAVQSEAGE